MKSTPFNKDNFIWDGMYLVYSGDQGDAGYYYIATKNTHPSRVRTAAPIFVARFKYGSKPWKSWVNFIVKNFSVEEWYALQQNGVTPVDAMSSKEFIHSTERKLMKEFGLRCTPRNVKVAWEMFKVREDARYAASQSRVLYPTPASCRLFG